MTNSLTSVLAKIDLKLINTYSSRAAAYRFLHRPLSQLCLDRDLPGQLLPKHSAPPRKLIRKQNRIGRQAIGDAFKPRHVLKGLVEGRRQKIAGFQNVLK